MADRKPFDAVLPDPDEMLRKKGHRLHLSADGEATYADLAEERVWPERIARPDANALEVTDRLILTRAGVEWLHAQLGKLLEQWNAEDAALKAREESGQ